MSDVLEKAISALQEKLQVKLTEASEIKKTINNICLQINKSPIYADVAIEEVGQKTRLRPDQFFGKPLSTAVKEYLSIKGEAAGADEIFKALKNGGFEFSGEKENIRQRNLRISLHKNPDIEFIKSSNTFGLAKNYGISKRAKKNKANPNSESPDTEVKNEEKIENS